MSEMFIAINGHGMSIEKKSPLTANPLRLPGQSIEEKMRDYVFDRLLLPYLVAAGIVLWAGYEWAIMLGFIKRPHPLVISVIAAIGVGYFVWNLMRSHKQLKALRQGRDGERAVGQFLEGLRSNGHFVFHDVLGEGFNLDHVIVGPRGVFTVETKTISKPAKGEARIKYDGNVVTIFGQKPERNPIIQAKAQADWLAELLGEETGKKVHVKPIVVYPGWFIEGPLGFKTSVEVLNPKMLPGYINKYSNILAETDMHLFKSTLSRRIRKTY
jgi:hypothetical protein